MKGTFRVSGPMDLDCDVLVIGSGAGGASVSDVLTRAGLDVVMLEEGPYVSASDALSSPSEAVAQSWRCGGLTAALGSPSVVYAEGRGVGGGTEINSAIFQRADGYLLDSWASRYAIAEFGADALNPYYDRAWKAVNASLTVKPLGRPSDILRIGAERLGWRTAELERAQRDCVGTNACSLVCPTGGKQSMSSTLLPAAAARGLRLVAECRIHKLILKGQTATGAVGHARDVFGRCHRVAVRAKTVFVCAGAVHTPALLQRSGLRGRIGKTLRLHPTIKAMALFDDPPNATDQRLPLHAVTEFMPEQRIGGSVFLPSFFGMALAEDWANRAHLLQDWRHVGIYYGMIRPRGMGRVTSVLPGQEPIVRYTHAPEDLAALAEIAGRLVKVMFAAGARQVIPSITGHRGWTDPGEAERDLAAGLPKGRTNLMTIHIFSSCPPGEALDATVTDSFGRVRGIANLIVADASQIPEASGCNPQATVMALAFRAAEAFVAGSDLERHRLSFRES